MIVDITKKENNEEALNEIALYSSMQEHICIHCDPDPLRKEGFFLDPYIKIYDGPSFMKAKNSVRIHLIDMGLNYSHSDGKGDMILNSAHIKLLNKIMLRSTGIVRKDKDGNDKILNVEEYIKSYLEAQAINAECVLITYPDIDFSKCHIRPGKEPKNETRKKFRIR